MPDSIKWVAIQKVRQPGLWLKTPVYASSSNIPATLKSHIDTQGSPPFHRPMEKTNRLSENGRFPQIFQRIQWWFMMVSIGLYYRLHEVAIFIGDPPSLGPMPIAGSSEWNSVSEERSITSFCFHKMSCAREFPSIFIYDIWMCTVYHLKLDTLGQTHTMIQWARCLLSSLLRGFVRHVPLSEKLAVTGSGAISAMNMVWCHVQTIGRWIMWISVSTWATP